MLRVKYKDLLEPYDPERSSDYPILSPTTYARRDKWMRNQAAHNLRQLKQELANEKFMSAAIELDSPEPPKWSGRYKSQSPIPFMPEQEYPPESPIRNPNPSQPTRPNPPFAMAQDQKPPTTPWKGALTPISPKKSVVPGLLQPPASLIMPWLLQLPVPLTIPTLPRSKYVPRLLKKTSMPAFLRCTFTSRQLEAPASPIIPTYPRARFKQRLLETPVSPITPAHLATSVGMSLKQRLMLVESPPFVMHQQPQPAHRKRKEAVDEMESTSGWGDQCTKMISKHTVPKRPFAPQRKTLKTVENYPAQM
ncbi:uncharacterized protein LOC6564205 [Drosophila grimshawi]|uniref:GH19370 n=1 Tax=Drosophila grimshawi TaxID=7222 RepID=B4JFQ0_DROGR|nr:uncharacterized protein LOC6564205 [Drosophila grimshawi]EDV93531.1 GH19370 [Drosophila grimshawi]